MLLSINYFFILMDELLMICYFLVLIIIIVIWSSRMMNVNRIRTDRITGGQSCIVCHLVTEKLGITLMVCILLFAKNFYVRTSYMWINILFLLITFLICFNCIELSSIRIWEFIFSHHFFFGHLFYVIKVMSLKRDGSTLLLVYFLTDTTATLLTPSHNHLRFYKLLFYLQL